MLLPHSWEAQSSKLRTCSRSCDSHSHLPHLEQKAPWALITLLHAWAIHQVILMWRLPWCSGKKSALGSIRQWYESWHCHSAAVCPWASHATSLSLTSFICERDFYNLPHGLMGGLNDIMDVKTLYKIWNTAHMRDRRMMVSSGVIAGLYIGCFLALLGSPHTSIRERGIGRRVSRGLSILGALRNNVDPWEGILLLLPWYMGLK